MELETTITLRNPVKLADMVYDKLELREPTAGELEKAATGGSNMSVAINLVSIVAKVPRRVVEGLCQRDMREAGDFLNQFNAVDLTAGATPSLS